MAILLDIKRQFTKELDNLAGNATIRQIQKEILLSPKPQYMQELNIPAGNATIKQLQRAILLGIL